MKSIITLIVALVAISGGAAPQQPPTDWAEIWRKAPVERKAALFETYFQSLRTEVAAAASDPGAAPAKRAYAACYENDNVQFSAVNTEVTRFYTDPSRHCTDPSTATRIALESICRPYLNKLNVPPLPLPKYCR